MIIPVKTQTGEYNIYLERGILKSVGEYLEIDRRVMIITDSGTIIRTAVDSIPVYGRSAAGVIVMRLSEGQTCAGFTTVPKAEEDDAIEGEEE